MNEFEQIEALIRELLSHTPNFNAWISNLSSTQQNPNTDLASLTAPLTCDDYISLVQDALGQMYASGPDRFFRSTEEDASERGILFAHGGMAGAQSIDAPISTMFGRSNGDDSSSSPTEGSATTGTLVEIVQDFFDRGHEDTTSDTITELSLFTIDEEGQLVPAGAYLVLLLIARYAPNFTHFELTGSITGECQLHCRAPEWDANALQLLREFPAVFINSTTKRLPGAADIMDTSPATTHHEFTVQPRSYPLILGSLQFTHDRTAAFYTVWASAT